MFPSDNTGGFIVFELFVCIVRSPLGVIAVVFQKALFVTENQLDFILFFFLSPFLFRSEIVTDLLAAGFPFEMNRLHFKRRLCRHQTFLVCEINTRHEQNIRESWKRKIKYILFTFKECHLNNGELYGFLILFSRNMIFRINLYIFIKYLCAQ
jgi:hypothetical protein